MYRNWNNPRVRFRDSPDRVEEIMTDMKFQAATYDFWNTLISETTTSIDRRRVLWTKVLLENGYEISQDHLDLAFAAGWSTFDTNWRKNIQTDLESVD